MPGLHRRESAETDCVREEDKDRDEAHVHRKERKTEQDLEEESSESDIIAIYIFKEEICNARRLLDSIY